MTQFQLKLTPRIVSLIGSIERFSGRFDSGAVQTLLAEGGFESRSLGDLSKATGAISLGELSEIPQSAELFLDWGFVKANSLFLRASNLGMKAPLVSELHGEELFETVQPFLVRKRLDELFSWATEELENGSTPPLLVVTTFHLVFLQLSPFERLNFESALILLRGQLIENGYGWIRYVRLFTPLLGRNYLLALKQAEKSVFTNWGTTPVFTEALLGILVECAKDLHRLVHREIGQTKLTDVQQRIIEVVRGTGSATREQIAEASGINPSTVKYNLGVLSGRGVLGRFGAGRTTSYKVT